MAAALAATGFGAYAAVQDSGTINACAMKVNGQLRLDTGSGCLPAENALQWNQQGPKGDTGLQGPSGPQGDPGPQGPAGTGPAYVTSSSTHVDLPGSYTNILDLSLPAGAWYISGSVNLGNFSGQRVPVLCALFGDNTGQIGNIAIAGLASYPGAGGDALTLHLSYAADLGSGDTVHLQCESNTGGGAVAFAEGRQLAAVQATSVTTEP
jgi:hypothetical protein